MEGAQNNEAMHLMDDELLPQGHMKVAKNTENIEMRKQNIKMMQGDIGYDVGPTSIDPLLWVPEEIESMLKEASEDIDSYEDDENAEIMPTAAKLSEENDVDSQTQSNEDMFKITEKDVDEDSLKRMLKVDLMLPQEGSDDEGEFELYKLLEREGLLGEELSGETQEIADEDNITLTEDNQKLCEELLEDERLVEEVMQKIKLMEERQEQLSASLEAVAEHAARNEAYMEEIYTRSSEQLEDLLSAINKHVDEDESLEEDEPEEKQEE